ncbi:MAG: hypothetical protein E7622_07820 [Ruminococcaceae bacterium]|nr:hypothetical protein [Oscillospiraceae bacterium]
MFKKIITIILYALLGGYALVMFAMMIGSGAVVAIVYALLISAYIAVMMISIKASRRLEKYKEDLLANLEMQVVKGKRILLLSLAGNLPYYFIYFVLSLIPIEFPGLWILAGLPCCLISALRPINQNYQRYNFLTNKSRLYWFIQVLLAIVLWLGGRMIILVGVLG